MTHLLPMRANIFGDSYFARLEINSSDINADRLSVSVFWNIDFR